MPSRLSVYPWPAAAAGARQQLRTQDIVAISVATGHHIRREQARVLIRAAAHALLEGWADGDILSISHVDELSVAIVGARQMLGVDVAHAAQAPHSRHEILQLAQDYLGPATAHALSTCPDTELSWQFVQHWAQWESGLKCHGLELQEWTPALQKRLQQCDYQWLDLQFPLVGCVAILKRLL